MSVGCGAISEPSAARLRLQYLLVQYVNDNLLVTRGASQRTLARRQEAPCDARLFEKGQRAGRNTRRHFEERDEIDGMVDVHPDPRLAGDERVDPTSSRRIEMRIKAVFAETERNRV